MDNKRIRNMDYSFENNSKEINLTEMRDYVINYSKYNITEKQYEDIELLFRNKWNELSGQFASKFNFIRYESNEFVNRNKFIMQELIEDTMLLILN